MKSVDKKKKAYARAGVDIDLGNRLKRQIQSLVKQTHGPEVLGKMGGFGGLFCANFSEMREPILVEPRVFEQLLRGFARACRSAGCALLGGETAQMPGMYRKSEYDLAGCIVGIVERSKIIDGRRIRPGDAILGLQSNGLHTNGYSLAREILLRKMRLKVGSRLPGSSSTVGEELLRVHKNYQPLLAKIPDGLIKGLAHITGGGLIDNLPRILPPNCDAVIETKSWTIPRIFQILQQNGKIDPREMYQVFNMGIGMVAVAAEKDADRAMSILRAKRIGRIERGTGKTVLSF